MDWYRRVQWQRIKSVQLMHHGAISNVLVLRSQLSVRTTLATSIYAKTPCSNPLVKYYTKFLTSDMLETMLLKLHTKLAPGWELIQVNLDPIQVIGSKYIEGRHSFTRGRSFVRLWCSNN